MAVGGCVAGDEKNVPDQNILDPLEIINIYGLIHLDIIY